MKNDSYILFQNFEMQMKRLSSLSSFLAVKAEFEAEGTRIDELAILSELCCKNSVPLTLKIGGPSAQRDIYEAFQLGATNILVPMVESKYGVNYAAEIFLKYLPVFNRFKTKPNLFINIESKQGIKNIDSIIEAVYKENMPIKRIVIGRKDLSYSLGINNVNCEKIYEISKELIIRSSLCSLKTTIGGNLTNQSYKFIKNLSYLGLDSFESRKCTFKANKHFSSTEFEELIKDSLEFELSWLYYKKNLYANNSNEENIRIKSILARLRR